MNCIIPGIEGFEPPKAEPESAVLPLHYIPKQTTSVIIIALYKKSNIKRLPINYAYINFSLTEA